MRFRVLASSLCLLVSLTSAQWLETTIPLSDSSRPVALCYNSQNNKVYCANEGNDSVTVIDGASNSGFRGHFPY